MAIFAGPILFPYRWRNIAFARHVQSEEFRRVLTAMDLCIEEPRIMIRKLPGHGGMAYLHNLREDIETNGRIW